MVTDLLGRPLPGPSGQTRPGSYHGIAIASSHVADAVASITPNRGRIDPAQWPTSSPQTRRRDAELLAADLLARWCPVLRTTGVVGELDGPPPPTVVLGVMPLLEKAYLAAGEQHG
jgi:hypothetical protein